MFQYSHYNPLYCYILAVLSWKHSVPWPLLTFLTPVGVPNRIHISEDSKPQMRKRCKICLSGSGLSHWKWSFWYSSIYLGLSCFHFSKQLNNIPTVSVFDIYTLHSSADRHLYCFSSSIIVNRTVMNMNKWVGQNDLPTRHYRWTNKPTTRNGLAFLKLLKLFWNCPTDHQTLQAISNAIGYLQTLLLNTLHIWIIEYGEVSLPDLETHHYQLAFIVLHGAPDTIREERYQSYQAVNPAGYNNDWPEKSGTDTVTVTTTFSLNLRSAPQAETHAWGTIIKAEVTEFKLIIGCEEPTIVILLNKYNVN